MHHKAIAVASVLKRADGLGLLLSFEIEIYTGVAAELLVARYMIAFGRKPAARRAYGYIRVAVVEVQCIDRRLVRGCIVGADAVVAEFDRVAVGRYMLVVIVVLCHR